MMLPAQGGFVNKFLSDEIYDNFKSLNDFVARLRPGDRKNLTQ